MVVVVVVIVVVGFFFFEILNQSYGGIMAVGSCG